MFNRFLNLSADSFSYIDNVTKPRHRKTSRTAEGGVTGMRNKITTDLESSVRVVKEDTSVPAAIGFGINTPEQAKKYAGMADGVIVGSAIVKIIEKYGENAAEPVYNYVKEMADAVK